MGRLGHVPTFTTLSSPTPASASKSTPAGSVLDALEELDSGGPAGGTG